MSVNQQWVQVSALISQTGEIRLPVADYVNKTRLAERNKKCSTLSFYNTGQSLFIEPSRSPANSFYHQPWQWIRFLDFASPRYIRVDDKKFAGLLNHDIMFQHLGHYQDHRGSFGLARIVLGEKWKDGAYVPGKVYTIPPYCVLHVAIRLGNVKDTLLSAGPLPLRLMQKVLPCLEAVEPQTIVAVSK